MVVIRPPKWSTLTIRVYASLRGFQFWVIVRLNVVVEVAGDTQSGAKFRRFDRIRPKSATLD